MSTRTHGEPSISPAGALAAGTPATGTPARGTPLSGAIAVGQRDGVLAALAEVPAREARGWGVPGDGAGLVVDATLLADPARGVLTGLVGWRLELTDDPPG